MAPSMLLRDISILIRNDPVLNVETGEILTVAGGLVIVLVIALIVNPHYLSVLHTPTPEETPVPGPTPFMTLSPAPTKSTTVTPLASVATPVPSSTPVVSYRIYYTDKPFSYPVVRLPDRLDMYGESDIKRSGQDVVTFAYIAESRGGLTRVFTIPYPVWTMDIRVIDNTTPNLASFRMALCYAANGTIIDGVELIHPGTAYKKIQTSNTPLYLIISTSGIDGYHIDLQTSGEYYKRFGAQQSSTP